MIFQTLWENLIPDAQIVTMHYTKGHTFAACAEVILFRFLPLVWFFCKNSLTAMAAKIILFAFILVN